MVSVVAWVVYSNFGLSQTYMELYQKALVENAQASAETDPARQRDAYQRVLNYVTDAEEYRQTDETRLLRTETQAKYDNLMGVIRLEFRQGFTNGLTGSVQISRMAASESDLYRHLRSSKFYTVLLVVEMAVEPPEIRFDVIAHSTGLETIEKTRT